MPITKTMAYKVGEETFPTLESAQVAEIYALLNGETDIPPATIHDLVSNLVRKHGAQIANILSCDPEHEKPVRKPRSDKGTKRAKAEAINRALQDGKQ